jgi:methyl-accepting chemotaxis protein
VLGLLLIADVSFNALVPFAYFSLFHIEDTRLFLGLDAAIQIARIAAWIVLFVRTMRPVERLAGLSPKNVSETLVREADHVLQTTPIRFSAIYSALWAGQYLFLGLFVLYAMPDRIALSPRIVPAAIMMAAAQLPGTFSFVYPLLALLFTAEGGRVHLLARERRIHLDRSPSSLQSRIVILGMCIGIGPTLWMAAVGYTAELDASMRDAAGQADRTAAALVAQISHEGLPTAEEATRTANDKALTEGEAETYTFVAYQGRIAASPRALEALARSPKLEQRLEAPTKIPGTVLDPHTDQAMSVRTVDGGAVVAALAHAGSSSIASLLVTIGIFGLIVLAWAPVCAILVARSVANPIDRISSLARQVVDVGNLSELDRVAIAQADEVGVLGEHFNDLLDVLSELGSAAREVARGDLNVSIAGRGELPDAFRDMVQSLQRVVREIRETSIHLATAATEIYAATQEQEASATSQSAAMDEISRTAESLSDAAAHVADAVSGVVGNAERTLQTTEQMIVRIGELSAHAGRISEILEVIRDIADRSDLLALNGSLEACRAGEAGRGFSLVAAEMRRLAERVGASVQDVKGLITDIRASGSSTVMATEESKKLAYSTTEAARQITLVTQQQRSGTEQVSQSVKEIAQVLSQAVAATTETRTSAEDLKTQADQLAGLVRRFQFNVEATSANGSAAPMIMS